MNKTALQNKLRNIGVALESAEVVPEVIADEPIGEMQVDPTQEEQNLVVETAAACNTHDQLSALAATLESMATTDGMSDMEAQLFGHARQAIIADTPLDTPVPALESFNTASARLNNAQVALEDVGSKLKEAYEWLSKKVKELIEYLTKKMKEFAEGTARTIAKLKAMTPRVSIGFKLSRRLNQMQFHRLSLNGTMQGFWNNHNKLVDAAELFYGTVVKKIVSILESAATEYRNYPAKFQGEEGASFDWSAYFADQYKSAFSNLLSIDYDDSDEKTAVFPGNYCWGISHTGCPTLHRVPVASFSYDEDDNRLVVNFTDLSALIGLKDSLIPILESNLLNEMHDLSRMAALTNTMHHNEHAGYKTSKALLSMIADATNAINQTDKVFRMSYARTLADLCLSTAEKGPTE